MSWQSKLKEDNINLRRENAKLSLKLEEKNKYIVTLEQLIKGPPTVLIACEKLVESAADQCKSANQLVRDARDIYVRRYL